MSIMPILSGVPEGHEVEKSNAWGIDSASTVSPLTIPKT